MEQIKIKAVTEEDFDQIIASAGGSRILEDGSADYFLNEAFIELAGQHRVQFETRGHFLAVASFMMRRILTEHARSRAALKRGGGNIMLIALDPDALEADAALADISAVDAALDALAKIDERAARVVVLRFFGGLSHEDTAEALGEIGRAHV